MDSSHQVRASPHMSPMLLIHSSNRCEPNPVLHENMVETKRLYDAGVRSGAIDEDTVMVGVPEGWRLVAAPPQMDSASYSLIFWEPATNDDCDASAAKVVSGLCCDVVY